MAGVPRVDNFLLFSRLVARVVSVSSPPPRKAAATLAASVERTVRKAKFDKNLRKKARPTKPLK